jgi:hypothetical protein
MAQAFRKSAIHPPDRASRIIPGLCCKQVAGVFGKVAEKHYLQVTDDHWRKTSDLVVVCGSARRKPSAKTHKTKKPRNSRALMVAGWQLKTN